MANACEDSSTWKPPACGCSVWKWICVSGAGPPGACSAQPSRLIFSAWPLSGIAAWPFASEVLNSAASAP
jgi:hypothetical protein